MAADPRVGELLDRWEELCAAGSAPTVEELCRDCPELTEPVRKGIAALQAFDSLADRAEQSTRKGVGPPPGEVPPPPAVAGFEILGELGHGGMGVVYQAREISLNRVVALKMILAGARAAPYQRQRFRQEAEAVARLRHPNIVQIYQVGEQEGMPYLSLEYVPGGSLSGHVQGRPQPPAETARLVETLARAMQHAHAQGIIHRDLKPGNVLLSPRPEGDRAGPADDLAGMDPKITDFGLARRLDVEGQTASDAVLGSPSYMAPEQAEGRSRQVGPAADVYGLGTILYELLTGRAPFWAPTAVEIIQQVVGDDPTPPSSVRPGVPRDLETICLKCLEKSPARRYASALALAKDLARFCAGEPVLARPVGRLGRGWRWARRHPARALSAALALLLLVGAATGGLLFAVSERRHARTLGKALADEQISRTRAEHRLAENYLDRGLRLCREGEPNLGLLWLVRALRTVPEGDDDLEHVLRVNLAGWRARVTPPRALMMHDGVVVAVAVSPDGRTCATGSRDGTARLWDTATGDAVGAPLQHNGPVWAVAFSPDGRTLATGSRDDESGTCQLWEVPGCTRVGKPFRQGGGVWAVAFGPEGRTVWTGGDDKTARCWEVATGRAVGEPLPHRAGVTALALDSAGRTLVTAADNDREVRVWDAVTGRARSQVLVHADKVQALAISPDGRAALVGSVGGTARLWDLTTGKPRGAPWTHQHTVHAVAFSRDGKQAATGSLDRTARLWEVATGRPAGPSLRHPDYVMAVTVVADGAGLLTACRDGAARLWQVPPRQPPGSHRLEHPEGVTGVAFTSDGRRALTRCTDKTVRLWDAASGQARGAPLRHDVPVTVTAFSPDGTTVATGGDKQARLWDTATGRPLSDSLPHPTGVRAIAFRPDARTLVTVCADQTLRLWEVPSGKLLGERLPHADLLMAVALSHDGERVLTSTQWQPRQKSDARLWDVATGEARGVPLWHDDVVSVATFSSDGRLCATGSRDLSARLWDAATGEPLARPLPHPGGVRDLAFSRDGRALATGSDDNTAHLWDVVSGAPLTAPLEHGKGVNAVAFSPDGRTLLTASQDGTARMWDVATGQPLGPALEHAGPVLTGDFSSTGRAVLTGSADRTAGLWPVIAPLEGDPDHLTEWAEVLTGMTLNASGAVQALIGAEWQQRRGRLRSRGEPPVP